MKTSKVLIALLAAVAIVAVFAVPAFALYGDAGYLTWASSASYTTTGSPHAGFATTTQKCVVCHAVHNADATLGSEILLRGSVANSCNYCHVNSASAYTQVYGSQTGNYSGTDYKNAHNSWEIATVEQGVKCTTCHQVHAADNMMTQNSYLTTKLLIGDKVDTGLNYDPIAGMPLSGDTSATALTKWCAKCHFVGLSSAYPYYRTAYNGRTHTMRAAGANYANPASLVTTRVAWRDSTECSSCHAAGYQTSAWPHYTQTAQRFLMSAANATTATPVGATNSKEDGVCLRCHRTGSSGINMSF